jgi:hypothetical protein
MDTARLWLAALLILAPPAAYTVGIIIYNRRRQARRDQGRPTVADIQARLTDDNDAADTGGTAEGDQPPLPRGWHWPSRDQDRL